MKRVLSLSLIAASSLVWMGLDSHAGARPGQQQKTRLIRQIDKAGPVPIYTDNTQESRSEVSIQEATVKEISADEFAALIGESARHFRQSTYPEMVLLNHSTRTIRSCAIMVQSAADHVNGGHFLLKKNLSILPDSTFRVLSSEWPMAERVSIQKEGKFVNELRQPGLDSAKSWLAGAASDLRVSVVFVEFTDGTKWMIPSDQTDY